MKRQARRIYRELTDEERQRVTEAQRLVAEELPDLIRRQRLARQASQEDSFSGELRRAIHGGDLTVVEIADRCGITPIMLDDFLTGEGTLQSDVLDRLTKLLRLTLSAAGSREPT